jgi:cytochrome c biogenesis protein
VDTGDGVPVFLLGMRENPSEPYRYLRPPADENGELTGFIRLRAALADAALRERAVQRYALKAVDPQRPDLSRQLADSAARALGLFAGLEKVKGQQVAGLQALSDFWKPMCPRLSVPVLAKCLCAS